MENKNKTSNNGISFVGLLQIAFIVLKFCKVIKWSWVWVLAPTWIPMLIGIVILLVLVIIKTLTK